MTITHEVKIVLTTGCSSTFSHALRGYLEELKKKTDLLDNASHYKDCYDREILARVQRQWAVRKYVYAHCSNIQQHITTTNATQQRNNTTQRSGYERYLHVYSGSGL